jgi:hypothetical protein
VPVQVHQVNQVQVQVHVRAGRTTTTTWRLGEWKCREICTTAHASLFWHAVVFLFLTVNQVSAYSTCKGTRKDNAAPTNDYLQVRLAPMLEAERPRGQATGLTAGG